MSQQNSDHDFYVRALEEHEKLRDLLRVFHEALNEQQNAPVRLTELATSLVEHLEAHFDLEEGGGLFNNTVQLAPRLADVANRLRGEHPGLLEEARAIVRCAAQAQAPAWLTELAGQFHQFSEDLMHHEKTENKLLQEAYTQDVGSKD